MALKTCETSFMILLATRDTLKKIAIFSECIAYFLFF